MEISPWLWFSFSVTGLHAWCREHGVGLLLPLCRGDAVHRVQTDDPAERHLGGVGRSSHGLAHDRRLRSLATLLRRAVMPALSGSAEAARKRRRCPVGHPALATACDPSSPSRTAHTPA